MRLRVAVVALLLTLALAGCSKPLPPAKAAYAGQWSGTGVRLSIDQDGTVRYQRVEGHKEVTINAPLQEFSGNDMVVGVGPLSTTFVVSKPPHQDGRTWKMTVDDVELTKQP